MAERFLLSIAVLVLMIFALPVTASAAEVLKAPIVQYKLINHDEIALRWTEADGADGYYVYRTDVDTGKTVRYTKYIKDTTFDITGLKASTDYIFKVAAVTENDGQISIGRKSNGTKLTTPDEWYYFKRHKYIPSKKTHEAVIERWHYNMTGMETYDGKPLQNQFNKDNSGYRMGLDRIFQDHGFVYLIIGGSNLHRTHDDAYFLYRMKNDGTGIEEISYIQNTTDKKIGIINDPYTGDQFIFEVENTGVRNLSWNHIYGGDWEYLSELFDSYKTNPEGLESEFILDGLYSSAELIYPHSYRKLRSENRGVLSGPAVYDENIFFLSEPLYNITDETNSTVYRVKIGDQANDISSEQVMCIPKDETLIYGDPNNGSIDLFHCDEKYLYYCVYGRKTSEEDKDNYYTFYRISLDDKTAVPQKLMSVDKFRSAEIINGYLYVSYTGYLRHKFNEEYVVGGERADILYKYAGDVKKEKYYRIKTDGTEYEEQDEPFEWRY